VHAANAGLGICELPYSRVQKDLQQFAEIIDWLDRQLMKTLEPGLISRFNPLPKLFASSATGGSHPD